VETWPKKVQDEALQSLLIIEARHIHTYRLSAEEWGDLQEPVAQPGHGEFVPEEIVEETDKRQRA
jgi:hypothetical protein